MASYTTSFKINNGKNILPIKRLEIFSADDWEVFVEEWLDLKKAQYFAIERFGGAGDKGRDVAAYVTDPKKASYIWDCFQCKHYDRPLMPSQVWLEFGKIIYYTYNGDYPAPRKYYFVAPKGCGTSFSTLLSNADGIKKGVLAQWKKEISESITSGANYELTPSLKAYIDKFDFSIFEKIQPKAVIEEHKKHPNHLQWFGGGLPDREILNEADIPIGISPTETEYVTQLVKAYGSAAHATYNSLADVPMDSKHYDHFKRARISFHHAEQLRNFSRDNLPNGTFELLQTEIYDGIVNTIEGTYANGYEKVKAVETQSTVVPITSNALREVTNIKDKTGVCHQLCNDKKLNWECENA